MYFSVSFVSGNAQESGRCLEADEEAGDGCGDLGLVCTSHCTLYCAHVQCDVQSLLVVVAIRETPARVWTGRCELCAEGGGAWAEDHSPQLQPTWRSILGE